MFFDFVGFFGFAFFFCFWRLQPDLKTFLKPQKDQNRRKVGRLLLVTQAEADRKERPPLLALSFKAATGAMERLRLGWNEP